MADKLKPGETLLAVIRATRDERNRIIRILEMTNAKLSSEAMLAIMEGKDK